MNAACNHRDHVDVNAAHDMALEAKAPYAARLREPARIVTKGQRIRRGTHRRVRTRPCDRAYGSSRQAQPVPW